jgi:hypothetical protein
MGRRLGTLALAVAWLVHTERTARADPRETAVWSALLLTAKASSDRTGPSLWLDAHARRGPETTTAIVRPGLGYRLSPTTSLWGGYAYIGAFADGDGDDVTEHRAWQQILHQDTLGPLLFQFRGRVEQRFRPDESPALRLRALARANVALWRGGPLAFASWNETFVAVGRTSWGSPAGFDQNRLFLGLALAAGQVRVEAGYTGISVRRADDSLLHQHAPTLWVFFAY